MGIPPVPLVRRAIVIDNVNSTRAVREQCAREKRRGATYRVRRWQLYNWRLRNDGDGEGQGWQSCEKGVAVSGAEPGVGFGAAVELAEGCENGDGEGNQEGEEMEELHGCLGGIYSRCCGDMRE